MFQKYSPNCAYLSFLAEPFAMERVLAKHHHFTRFSLMLSQLFLVILLQRYTTALLMLCNRCPFSVKDLMHRVALRLYSFEGTRLSILNLYMFDCSACAEINDCFCISRMQVSRKNRREEAGGKAPEK